ncbi:glycosyltransferase [Enterococcus sp. UD-01]|uniref:glycosyltransferase n=1 Tax=Enterococcus sp. UD-01 TaxID=3373911 RepID=UPI003833018D
MKKTALFFGGCFLSHIMPLKSIIKTLKSEGYSVIVLNSASQKDIIESFGANFKEYPCDIDQIKYREIETKYLNQLKEAQHDGDVHLYYELITKIGAIRINNFDKNILNKLSEIAEAVQPSIIFSDSINLYGKYISEKLNIECIGYITNNMYNTKFLTTRNGFLWKVFSRSWGISHLYSDSFFANYWSYLVNTYKNVANENNIPYIRPMKHFEPTGKKKIVFSSKYIQPKRALEEKKNYFFIPNIHQEKEDSIDVINDGLATFLNTKRKVVYIAHGSYLDINLDNYIPLIKLLINNDIKIVVSTGKYNEHFLNQMSAISSSNKMVFCDDFIDQNFVLGKADLFITHGGMNSIMEAIGKEVPMLLNPVTPEQRINSLIINNKKIGITNYKRTKFKTTGEAIFELLNNSIYKENLHKLNIKINEESKSSNSKKLMEFIESGD